LYPLASIICDWLVVEVVLGKFFPGFNIKYSTRLFKLSLLVELDRTRVEEDDDEDDDDDDDEDDDIILASSVSFE
jgi:hypothetical protein